MATEAQKKAKAEYRKKCKAVCVEFSQQEMDLYEYVASKGNKQGFIKELIRNHMNISSENL